MSVNSHSVYMGPHSGRMCITVVVYAITVCRYHSGYACIYWGKPLLMSVPTVFSIGIRAVVDVVCGHKDFVCSPEFSCLHSDYIFVFGGNLY